MKQRHRQLRTATATAALVLLLCMGPARAQGMAMGGSVRADGDDSGIALAEDGRSRLHLGIDAGLGFDTNPYTTPLATGDFNGDGIIRLRPYVEAAMPGALVEFRGRAAFDYGALPGVVNPETQSFLLYQGSVSADAEINRGGMLNFAVGDSVSLNTDPGVVALGSLLSRVNNQVRLGAGLTPGGGSLRFRLGFASTLVHFFADERVDSFVLLDGLLDSLNNTASLTADYRFLPKTGAFLSLNGGWQLYPFARRTTPQAFPVGARVGLQGQFLTKLSGLVSLGFENPMVFTADGLQSGQILGLVGQVEAQWMPAPSSSLAAGYRRTFDPVALYQYLGQSRVYLRGSQLLGVTELTGSVSWALLEYGKEDTGAESRACPLDQPACDQLTDTPVGRNDHVVAVGLRASYYVMPWLSVGISNNLDWRITNASTVASAISTSINLSYLRNETMLMASARY